MELIKLAFIISMITMGLYTVTQKGMILYFLRKPFDTVDSRLKGIIFGRTGTGDEILSLMRSVKHMEESGEYSKMAISLKKDSLAYLIAKGEDSTTLLSIISYIGKPIILCPPCMASLHTILWFFLLDHNNMLWTIAPVALIGSFTNSILMRLASKLK